VNPLPITRTAWRDAANRAGVAAVDIIDLQYPQWHTAQDDLDHVSQASLQVVGDVVLAALPQIETKLTKTLVLTGRRLHSPRREMRVLHAKRRVRELVVRLRYRRPVAARPR
jgi:hypothetical protein